MFSRRWEAIRNESEALGPTFITFNCTKLSLAQTTSYQPFDKLSGHPNKYIHFHKLFTGKQLHSFSSEGQFSAEGEKKNKNSPIFQNSPDVFSLLTVKPWIIHFNPKSPPKILLSSKTIVQFAKVILICQTEISMLHKPPAQKKEEREEKIKGRKKKNEMKTKIRSYIDKTDN